MTKKLGLFEIDLDIALSDMPIEVLSVKKHVNEGRYFDDAINLICKQINASRYRARTIKDYETVLGNFRKSQNRMCDFWGNEDELVSKVTIALMKTMAKSDRAGWIRGNTINTEEMLGEIKLLNEENRSLKKVLARVQNENRLKQPLIEVMINEERILNLNYDENIDIPFIEYLAPINDISDRVKDLVKLADVEEYNSNIEEVNQQIQSYNTQIKDFYYAKNFGVECELIVENNGNTKADGIFADLTFPNEVKVIKGCLED